MLEQDLKRYTLLQGYFQIVVKTEEWSKATAKKSA